MVVNFNSVSGDLSIAPDQGTHHSPRTTNNSYLIFHGVGLNQEGLKDWLRNCAKQVNATQAYILHGKLITYWYMK